MDRYLVNGGKKIQGEIRVDGAKNAVLPILAATIINSNESVIHNVPELRDVDTLIGVLKTIGCKCFFENNTLIVKSDGPLDTSVPERPVREMRSSIILLGAMISRCGQVKISYPGGYAS
ncbi:MAG: UDP-N-acetylglucosamine 1-carboxyvinyltransferase [Bacillota bacterium]